MPDVVAGFIDGDGQPDCPKCGGRGAIDYKPPGAVVPGVLTCSCVHERDIRLNMERGWRGLSSARPQPSQLHKKVDYNLWLTVDMKTFRRMLNAVCLKKRSDWRFQVSSDADLMTAWLSTIPSEDLIDADVGLIRMSMEASTKFAALVDLVEPPDLLILCVSVKAARNSAMPEVLLEALQHRNYLNKPTWIVDEPNKRLEDGHIAFDAEVGSFLRTWEHIDVDAQIKVHKSRAVQGASKATKLRNKLDPRFDVGEE